MAEPLAPGVEEMNNLQAAGFSPQEIDQWKAETTTQLQDGGFNSQEVEEYFGVKTPDMAPTQQMIQTNLAKNLAVMKPSEAPTADMAEPAAPTTKEAESFIEALEAGFDMSVVGLMKGRPDVLLPEHAPMYMRIAQQVGQITGDVPAMVAGAFGGAAVGTAAGGIAGSAVPVVGNVAGAAAGGLVGAGAGSMALPEALRTVMMQHYEKGDVTSFSDFWERASATMINTVKAGTVGAVTAGVGGVVAKGAIKVAAPTIVKSTATVASEIATATTVGATLDGRVPEPSEFIDGAILTAGMIGSVKAASKIRQIYGKSGVTPAEVAQHAHENAKFRQEILADNVPVPMSGELGVVPQKPVPPDSIPTVKPLKEYRQDLSPEVNSILGKVGAQAEKTKKSMTTDQLYTALVDKLDPINKATATLKGAKELAAADNPYVLARTAVDAPAKAKHMFENGLIDYHTLESKGRGTSLKSTLESVKSVETLEAYMISKRVMEKNAQGTKTGFDVEAARKVVEQHKVEYEAAAQKVTEFSNGVLDYVAQSGVISKEQAARMKAANKDYVPFKRIMDADDAAGSGKKQGKAGSLKEFKGSERDIQSPILSIVENTVELAKMAEINRPKEALVRLAESVEGQDLIQKVKTPVEEIQISKADVAKQLGISEDAAEAVNTFRAVRKELAPDQFAVYKDGKRQIYQTTPELAEAINRLGGDTTSTNMLFKMMHGITAVKKFGITFTPDFIIRNFFRDTLTANTFSKSKSINPLEIASAIGDIWKKNDTYYDWLKSGGANGAFLEMGDRYVKTDIYKLQKETNFMGAARNVIEKPIEIMRVAAELTEQSLRVAEFKKVRAKGGSNIEGGFASREITIDFQRVGAKVSALNSITAFMNVSIQGLDRTARAVKENPTGVATKSLAYITVPSMLLWWANKDDPRYQEIPRWEKDMFWIIPTDSWQEASPEEADGLPDYMVREVDGALQVNKGTIYRLPKPQELGIIFGSLPERIAEKFFMENESSMKEFDKTMVGLVTPSFIPDAVSPAIEQYFNKSFFTGRDIIPHHLKGVLPEYQFVEYTSETAKQLGKMVATVDRQSDFASPMVLQNYIRSWGGALGQYAVQVADKALIAAGVTEDRVKPTSTLADVPFVKSFVVRYPMAGTNSVQDFQDNYKENKQILDTIRHLAKEGDFESMEKEMTLNANQDNLVQLDGINEALAAQSNLIRLVSKNPEMTPDEKRQIIDGAYLMMTESAKQGNLMMKEIKKQLGE